MTTITAKPSITQMPAVEAAARCELSSASPEAVTAESTVLQLVEVLIAQELYDDAIRIWAASFPPRQAIWWSSLCVWEAYRDATSSAADEGFRCLVEWIEEPSDSRRRVAPTLVKPVGAATPLGILLQALFQSGGSISPPDLPKFEPDPMLFRKLVAQSVLLTAKQLAMQSREDRRVEFIERALQIANESITWQRRGPAKQESNS